MKVYTVAEALELEDKTPLTSIKGTLTKVWPPKKFKIKKGPNRGNEGTVQNLTLEDDTGTINIKNWAEPLPASDKGEEFIFESHKGAKGWKGLEVVIDNYDNSKIISMNENAKIKNADGTLVSTKKPTSGKPGREDDPPPSRDPHEVATEAKEGCRLSMQMALELRKEMHQEYGEATGEDIGADQINSWASSINYYLRDKGVLPALRIASKSRPEPKTTGIRGAKPTMTNPPEDEIPF